MNKIFYIGFLLVFTFFTACSSSEETTSKEQETESTPEIYVFDDVTETLPDTTDMQSEEQNNIEEVESPVIQYLVQVGAFTTRERADNFLRENSSKVDYQLNISYSDKVKLFVVQLPPFSTREEAERVRNKFWQSGIFKDAFIVTK